VRSILAIGTFLILTAAQAAPQASIEGRWANPAHSVIVDLAPCGGAMCGTVAWASAAAQQDARKGTNQLVGTQLLTDLQPDGTDWQGKLFVPDEKMRVTGKIQLISDQELKVSGCAFGDALCKSQVWTRADGPLPASD
jgi:uncharacterized protein (DUF2147 family)